MAILLGVYSNELLDEHFRGLSEENESVSAWMCRVASMLEADTDEGTQLMYVILTTGIIMQLLCHTFFS